MAPPDLWKCDLYVAEYRAFIDAENDPDTWRFIGKRYKSDTDGELYDWNMLRDWQNSGDCALKTPELGSSQGGGSSGSGGAGAGASGGGIDTMTAVGVVVGLLGLGGVAAGGGGGGDDTPPSKSPG